jgi:hypothetical protein
MDEDDRFAIVTRRLFSDFDFFKPVILNSEREGSSITEISRSTLSSTIFVM